MRRPSPQTRDPVSATTKSIVLLDSPVSALPPEDAARFTPTRRHDDTYLKWGEVIYALSNGLRLETTAGGGLKSSNGKSEAKAETSR